MQYLSSSGKVQLPSIHRQKKTNNKICNYEPGYRQLSRVRIKLQVLLHKLWRCAQIIIASPGQGGRLQQAVFHSLWHTGEKQVTGQIYLGSSFQQTVLNPLLWFWANAEYLLRKYGTDFSLTVARKEIKGWRQACTPPACPIGPSLWESHRLPKQHSDGEELSAHGSGGSSHADQSIHHGSLGVFRLSLSLPYSPKDWAWPSHTMNTHTFYTIYPGPAEFLKYTFPTRPPMCFSQGTWLTLLRCSPHTGLWAFLAHSHLHQCLDKFHSPPQTIWTSKRMAMPYCTLNKWVYIYEF